MKGKEAHAVQGQGGGQGVPPPPPGPVEPGKSSL